MDVLRKHDMPELRPGQRILVRTGRGPKGLTATSVYPVLEAVLSSGRAYQASGDAAGAEAGFAA